MTMFRRLLIAAALALGLAACGGNAPGYDTSKLGT